LKEITTTGKLPDVFKDQVANINHQFHLTVTKRKRDQLARHCSKAYYDTITDNQRLEFRGMYYADGMEIKCVNNFEISNDVRVTNKQIFKTIDVNKESNVLTTHNNNMGFSLWVDAFTLNQHFIANYASTIDTAQGTRVDVPFSVWEMDHPRFSLNRFNSAVGRAVMADLVHFSHTDTTTAPYILWVSSA
jgi:hypothetical protein